MRASLMPGEDPMTLRTPEEFAPMVASFCSPESTETGKLYDYREGRIKNWRAPD
jgi:hypothetical protein